MLTNYHTHTVFCDGCDTAEEMVLCAIDKGFDALGFSGHGYTSMDSCYCIKDLPAYQSEIRRLQKKYASKLQIYLGVEEDMYHPASRLDFDYIIGSAHYIRKDGKNYAVDSGEAYFRKCMELFQGDPVKMAESYYGAFCEYILNRKPDIVGHFDLITKYDEINENMLLSNAEYLKIAETYMARALESDCIFEVNTGAIARGMRTTPYPCEHLLHVMKKHGAKLILSSDCHSREMLDCKFRETRALLKSVGFSECYVLYDGIFRTEKL